MKYIKEFADNAAYTAYTSSADFVTPNVSYIVEDNAVEMTPYVPPVIEPKWIATYSDSHVESGKCGGSNSIVSGEVTTTNLVDIQIADCVTSIGDGAFGNCQSLTSVTIPDSVTSIGNYAFAECGAITSITIPSGVTSIGDNAFFRCTSLTSIDIPSGVTNMGAFAFASCRSLSSVTVNATTPPAAEYILMDTPIQRRQGYIYVPAESVEAYKSSDGWTTYSDRITAIPNS